MKNPNIKIVKEYGFGATLQETMKLVKGHRMPSNNELDVVLQNEELYKKYRKLFYCRSGTLVIYSVADKPFKEFVKFDNLVFVIPRKFQGIMNKALVIEHPNWSIEEINTDVPYCGKVTLTKIKAAEKNISAVDFPKENGWYLPEENYGIPNGKASNSSNPKARRLWKRDNEDYIGPLARYDDDFYDFRRYVGAYRRPDGRLGVGWVEGTQTTGKIKKNKENHKEHCDFCKAYIEQLK